MLKFGCVSISCPREVPYCCSNFRMTSIDQNGTVVFNLGLRPDDKHPAYDVADTGEQARLQSLTFLCQL